MLVGRALSFSYNNEQTAYTLPVFISGVSAWYLFAIAFINSTKGVSALWWIFLIAAILFMLWRVKSFTITEASENFWSKIFFITLWAVPTLIFATGDMPLQISEMNTTLHLSEYIYNTATLPNLNKPQYLFAGNGIASVLPALPTMFFIRDFSPAPYALFNIILLVLSALALLRVTEINLKWSNMALATVGAIISITLLNPFFNVETLLAATPTILLSVTLLAAVFPLLLANNLPRGAGVIPAALAFALLVGINNYSIWLCAFLLPFWVLRYSLEENNNHLGAIIGIILLIITPLSALYMWSNVSGSASPLLQFGNGEHFIALLTSTFSAPLWQLLLCGLTFILTIWTALHMKGERKFRIYLTEHTEYYVPALLILAVWAGSLWVNWPFKLEHLQFIVLAPLWGLAHWLYKGSKLEAAAYRSPWKAGLSLALMFMVLQLSQSSSLKQRHNFAMQHSLEVAEHMRKNSLGGNNLIAVIGLKKNNGIETNMLNYGLRKHAYATDVYNLFVENNKNIPNFHQKLRERKISHLWIYSPNNNIKKALNAPLKSSHSYLFSVNKNGFRLDSIYPHIP